MSGEEKMQIHSEGCLRSNHMRHFICLIVAPEDHQHYWAFPGVVLSTDVGAKLPRCEAFLHLVAM